MIGDKVVTCDGDSNAAAAAVNAAFAGDAIEGFLGDDVWLLVPGRDAGREPMLLVTGMLASLYSSALSALRRGEMLRGKRGIDVWNRGTRNRGTRHASHVTRHTPHVTRHTSHVTRHTSHATRHTSHVTRSPSAVGKRHSVVLCCRRTRLLRGNCLSFPARTRTHMAQLPHTHTHPALITGHRRCSRTDARVSRWVRLGHRC